LSTIFGHVQTYNYQLTTINLQLSTINYQLNHQPAFVKKAAWAFGEGLFFIAAFFTTAGKNKAAGNTCVYQRLINPKKPNENWDKERNKKNKHCHRIVTKSFCSNKQKEDGLALTMAAV
jgi:hypothetical protein